MTFDELELGISYSDTCISFADYLTEENQDSINLVLQKWESFKEDYITIENAFSSQLFTDDEVKTYALWKTVVCYSEMYGFNPTLSGRIFDSVLLKFTAYYLTLGSGA